MSSSEKVREDFDLERVIDMFDEALTSEDERVVNALRSLMMMVVLTKPEGRDRSGPIRQIYDDLHNLTQRMGRIERDLESVYRKTDYYNRGKEQYDWADIYKEKYTMYGDDFEKQLAKLAASATFATKPIAKK